MERYYLWTIGCQMNDADAQKLRQGLASLGLYETKDAWHADLVVLVTCVVRQSAEDKVVGRLASLKNLKQRRLNARIVVMGCFVGDEAKLRSSYPFVDRFLRPSDIDGVLGLVAEESAVHPQPMAVRKAQGISAYVPISFGCDHHCTYCIVRVRRGPQSSRPLNDIVADARSLAATGAREVTLLGQNVDAYGHDLPAGLDLACVLQAVHAIPELWRVRFLTSHPAEMSGRLIATVASLPRVCPHFELPIQAGDDEVLRRMGRHFTRARYLALVDEIRQAIPGCSIATDIIVGFPGETDAQFEATYHLCQTTRFDAVHIAKYSPRPDTPAARMPDDVPEAEKERRRAAIETLQQGISHEINQSLVGKEVDVLVDGKQRDRWRGRTSTNKLVFFDSDGGWYGRLARVRLTAAGAWSLQGEVLGEAMPPA